MGLLDREYMKRAEAPQKVLKLPVRSLIQQSTPWTLRLIYFLLGFIISLILALLIRKW